MDNVYKDDIFQYEHIGDSKGVINLSGVNYPVYTINNNKMLSPIELSEFLMYNVSEILKYYKDSDFIPISNLFERPYLYDYLFPKLYKALKFKNAKNNILILLNDYLAAGIVPVEDLKITPDPWTISLPLKPSSSKYFSSIR